MVGYRLGSIGTKSLHGEMVGNHHFHPLKTGCLEFHVLVVLDLDQLTWNLVPNLRSAPSLRRQVLAIVVRCEIGEFHGLLKCLQLRNL